MVVAVVEVAVVFFKREMSSAWVDFKEFLLVIKWKTGRELIAFGGDVNADVRREGLLNGGLVTTAGVCWTWLLK